MFLPGEGFFVGVRNLSVKTSVRVFTLVTDVHEWMAFFKKQNDVIKHQYPAYLKFISVRASFVDPIGFIAHQHMYHMLYNAEDTLIMGMLTIQRIRVI